MKQKIYEFFNPRQAVLQQLHSRKVHTPKKWLVWHSHWLSQHGLCGRARIETNKKICLFGKTITLFLKDLKDDCSFCLKHLFWNVLKLKSKGLRSEAIFFLAESRDIYKSHACVWCCRKAKAWTYRVTACWYRPYNLKFWHKRVTEVFIKISGAFQDRELNDFLSDYVRVNLWFWRSKSTSRKRQGYTGQQG